MIRIYKSKADQNRFVQLFFNELNMTIGFTSFFGLLIFFLAPFDYQVKILLIGLIGGIFGWLFYQRTDGKSLTSVIYSSILFLFSSKKYTQTQISNMSDFYHNIQNNLVYTTDQILAVVQIFPVDVSILNEQEKTTFKTRMATFLHTLGDFGSIQMRVVNRLATTADYKDHFDNLLEQSRKQNATPKVMTLVTNYINNMKEKIETQNVPFKDYFLIIPQKIGPKPSPENLKSYRLDHERSIANLCGVLASNEIVCHRLEESELVAFYSETISNYN